MTPKITLDNFQLMGDGTTYWLENFDVEKIGGKNVLKTSFRSSKILDTSDTYGSGFSNLTTLKAFSTFNELDGSKNIIGFGGQYIFMFPVTVVSASKGEIQFISSTGSNTNQVYTSDYPDIVTTKEGNLLYTSSNHLGIGVYGKCKTGSSTTKIIDSAGRNFTTLGVLNAGAGSTTPAAYVYNLTTKTRFQISSVSTTTSTNDTLNFTAGTANNANDEYIVFIDNGWTGSANFKFNTSLSRDSQFKGQAGSNEWKRQIELFGNDYWITNGNYIASLNVDMATWSATAKQLPYSTQATTISANNSQILVGGDYNGSGKLMLWDGYSDGWNSIMDVELAPQAIYPYDNGWMYTDGINIYFTNGYSRKLIAKIPDSNSNTNYPVLNFNGFIISEDKIIINGLSLGYNRSRYGMYIYDITNDGFTFSSFRNKSLKEDIVNSNNTGLLSYYANNRIYTIYSTSDSIQQISKNSSTSYKSTITLFVKLPKKMRLNKVEMNIDGRMNSYAQSLTQSYSDNIYLSVGQGRRPMWTYSQVGAASTVSSLVNTLGGDYPAKTGQKVLIGSGVSGGEVTWITSITNPGTATETWAISPSLSTDISSTTTVLVQDVYDTGKRIIPFDSDVNFNETLEWGIKDFFSDKLFIDIYIDTDNQFIPLQINSINIY